MAESDIGVVANPPFLGLGFHPASGIPLLGDAGLMAAGSTGRAFSNWGWDKLPSGHSSESSPTNSLDSVQIAAAGVDSKRKFSPSESRTDTDEDRGNGHSHSQSLALSLAAAANGCLSTEETERNPKRCALFSSSSSSSPPSQYPKCQVDDCGMDLRQAKDYHRRHKVCESHSKASQALVHQIMQRFCQQCSRFHSLALFDEGKRSCRRRLAGHNRRRRKNLTTPAPLPSDAMRGSELLKMVALLSQIQSASCLENGNNTPPESKDASTMMKMIKQAGLNNNNNNNPFARSHSPETQEISLMQRLKSTSEETCLPSIDLSWKENENRGRASQKGQDYQLTATFESPSPSLNSASYEDSEIQVLNLIDRVGSSTFDYTLHSSAKPVNRGTGKANLPVVGSPGDSWKYEPDINAGDLSIEMQACSRSTDTGFVQSLAMASSYCQARIALKLMDIDPRSLPQSAQSELLNWIAAVPSAVETYIRPGCVILTAFLCMQAHAFEEICLNLQEYLEKFLKSSPGSVWHKGRIIVQMGTQQVLIVDGSITSSTQLDPKAWPKLKSVHPLAAVAGKETTLTVEGQNLVKGTKIICSYRGKYTLQESAPEVDERLTDDMRAAVCADELRTRNVQFRGGPRDTVGRCFVEVVDELCGDFLPVIIADATICEELRTLEQELDTSRTQEERFDLENPATATTTTGYYIPCKGESEEVICFLHELGWVFEKSYNPIDDYHAPSSSSLSHSSELSRYKWLLSFAVLRDWCAVVKRLLDIAILSCIVDGEESESLLMEVQAMLSDSNLLHQAVGRKCRPMVELLLSYVPPCAHSELIVHVFKPSVVASGLTPLHIAASMPDCQQIVDALTDEVGLQVWKNGKDSVGQTPEGYARERGYTSYLKLVEMKLESKRADSVNIQMEDLVKLQEVASSSDLMSSRRSERHLKSSPIPCKECSRLKGNISGMKGSMYRPLVLSMVAIATVCVCVTLFLKSPPRIGSFMHPWRWEDIDFGSK